MGLSDLQVKKLVPRDRRFEVSDGKGLSIRITPNGTKTWIFRYQFNGVPRRMSLGSYPGIGLADARHRHAEAMQKLQKGIDPGRKAQEEKRRFKAAPTVRDLVTEIWEMELKEKRSGPETLRLLEKDVIPVWGKRKVSDVKRRDIVLLLDGIVKRGSPVTRNRVHSALTRVFNFAAERGVVEDSPCTRIRKLPETSKKRVLSDEEIKILWEALDLEKGCDRIFWTTRLCLKLVLLTGQRSGEISGMTWTELDLDRNLWTIPADRMKNNFEHNLPLAAMSREIIDEAGTRFGTGNRFVFPSPRNGPIRRHSLSRAILRNYKEMGIESPFTPHDMRRTVRTRLAELGIDEFIAERVMGHRLQGMLAVYNQHEYLQEKYHALELWENRLRHLLGLSVSTESGKVISLEDARHGKR